MWNGDVDARELLIVWTGTGRFAVPSVRRCSVFSRGHSHRVIKTVGACCRSAREQRDKVRTFVGRNIFFRPLGLARHAALLLRPPSFRGIRVRYCACALVYVLESAVVRT